MHLERMLKQHRQFTGGSPRRDDMMGLVHIGRPNASLVRSPQTAASVSSLGRRQSAPWTQTLEPR
jgi:hypothetical protein